MLKEYYRLTKPGIVYGNLITAAAGFLFASRWHFSPLVFLAVLIGLAFVVASACVFNNYLDRDIDAKMARTRGRATASGTIGREAVVIFGGALGICGFAILFAAADALCASAAAFGFIVYVFFYTPIKRASYWSTAVGSSAGAAPIVVGYAAAIDRLDLAAFILFVALALWQMPHFYAIALYRIEEYRAANIPILPLAKNIATTKKQIVWYIAAFTLAAASLSPFGFAGISYFVIVLLAGIAWLAYALAGFSNRNAASWARGVFKVSLLVMLVFSCAIALAPLLP